MKHANPTFLTCILAAVCAGGSRGAWATDYVRYVKANGSDTNTGTSWDQAWQTLSKVQAAITLDTGESLTIYLRHDDTISGYFDSDNVSDQANVITIKGVNDDLTAAAGSSRPVILGQATNTPAGSGTVYGSHIVIGKTINVVIENLQFVGQDFFPTSGNVGMVAIQRAKDVIVDNCVFDGKEHTTIDSPTHHYNAGIKFKGTTGDVELTNTTIRYIGPPCLWGNPELPSGDDGDQGYINTESIGLSYGHTDQGSFLIENNVIHNCNSDCIQIENLRGAATATIRDNALYNCGENALDIKYSQNHLVEHNHLYRDATFVGAGGIPYGPDDNGLLQLLTYADDTMPDNTNNIIRENLLGPNDTACVTFKSHVGSPLHDNDVYNNRLEQCATVFQLHNLDTDMRIFNNVAIGFTVTALESWTYGSTGRSYNLWENNTFISTTGTSQGLLWLRDSGDTFRNNIFFTNDASGPMCDHDTGNPIFESNIWVNAHTGNDVVVSSDVYGAFDETEVAAWNATSNATGDMFSDPEVDLSSGTPLAGSFCVDKGAQPTSATVGLALGSTWSLGNWSINTISRAAPNGADVGAYEYSDAHLPAAPTGLKIE